MTELMHDGAFLNATLSLRRLHSTAARGQALERLHSRQRGKWLSLHCLASTPILSVLSETLVRVKAKQHLATDGSAGTTLEVQSEDELKALPFWAQGDRDLNTQAALEARARLRKVPAIVAELQRWWDTAQRSMQSAGDASRDELTRDEYIRMSRLLSKAISHDFDPLEAQQAAEEDWEADASADGRMPRARFMDAIFEVGTGHGSHG